MDEWNDRHYPSMSTNGIIGKSTKNNPFAGNKDRQYDWRFNSPWTDNGFRGYVLQYYRWANYQNGNGDFNRIGAGGEWLWDRMHAWVEVTNRQLTGDKAGVKLGWSQWLNDQWQYKIVGNTYSLETPLQAELEGLSGRIVRGELYWRQSESRSASISSSFLNISDGNLRISVLADYSQRIQASAHHLTRAGILLSYDHNTKPGGGYYNPANLESLAVNFHHDWITWRRYKKSFTQNFEVSFGPERQSGFSTYLGYDFLYSHTWKLSRTWSLVYGVGWGSHVYDGGRVRRIYGLFGMSGVL